MTQLRYKMKYMLRKKDLLFWNLAFPVFLGFVFYFMFGNMNNEFQFETISIGIVNAKEDEAFVEILKSMEAENGSKMFQLVEFGDEEKAFVELDEEQISCYIDFSQDYELNVKDSGIANTIVKSIITQYKEVTTLFTNVGKKSPEQLAVFIEKFQEEQEIRIQEIPLKGQDKDCYTQYFYALLAMTCLMASMGGLEDGMGIQPELSSLAARRNVAPTKKMLQFGIDFLASFFLFCVLVSIVLFLCIYGYGQDFGDRIFLVLLASWVGIFNGLVAGNMIAIFTKGSKQKKDTFCTTFFMLSSFLGGLQWGDITYYIEKTCPFINRINPATLIVNSYRSLMVFGDYKAYAVNLFTLLGMGIVGFTLCVLKLRRERYASI